MKTAIKLLVISVLIIGAAIFLYVGIEILLAPNTPLEYAEQQSGLKLPDDMKLIKFNEDRSSPNGDGDSKIEFALTSRQMVLIQKECIVTGYKKLPITENGYTPYFLHKTDTGYYKLKISPHDERSYELTMLIISKKELYLYKIDL